MSEAPVLAPSPAARPSAAGQLDLIRPQPYTDWAPEVTPEARATLRRELEQGAVLYFPNLKLQFQPGEERFLDARYSDGKS
ncbi:MAG: 3-deoxy-D-manno-oct-2-ulosonic acid (Kdo) hydroxylase, partial [Cupriavidus sp.]|nr:3-deoxy-D-manno-oct-2-ulosonic acid (Kdo) hydroxylase [Cupriavidus sp.]